ncbi:FecCD family ABC transporter permease [Jiella marina]|uniref:FecCD family ABC transporter permease n=1 Tax=Jiella sp. LLJ827 TaxID=2917712 RepID=UPI0021009B45|nr:iron ABC transporter permease [Jiella sp. LLJ827]MCQ0988030.1 iron ABC transporter permease [Jiella sp. LLJ827]
MTRNKRTITAVRRDLIVAPLLVMALMLSAVWGLTVGASRVSLPAVFDALAGAEASYESLIVTTVRLPRIVAALAIGSALAVAGALMQAMTNNPLASPGLLGINAGAAFSVVLAVLYLEPMTGSAYAWFAFAGAGIAAFLVHGLGSVGPGGATPLKLALAGIILSSFIASLTTMILVTDRATLDVVRLWTVGSLTGRQIETVLPLSLHIVAGLAATLLIARQVTTLGLGPDISLSLGQNLILWRLICGALVVLLAGSAVAIAGPVGFVGLVVPHAARIMFGTDYRRVLPYSALMGAMLVLLADTAVRGAFSGVDLPVGVTMALIGAPFFVYLARRRLAIS